MYAPLDRYVHMYVCVCTRIIFSQNVFTVCMYVYMSFFFSNIDVRKVILAAVLNKFCRCFEFTCMYVCMYVPYLSYLYTIRDTLQMSFLQNDHSLKELMACVDKALSSSLTPFIPKDFTFEEYIERVKKIFTEL